MKRIALLLVLSTSVVASESALNRLKISPRQSAYAQVYLRLSAPAKGESITATLSLKRYGRLIGRIPLRTTTTADNKQVYISMSCVDKAFIREYGAESKIYVYRTTTDKSKKVTTESYSLRDAIGYEGEEPR